MLLFLVKTAKQWRDENPGNKGNIRDIAYPGTVGKYFPIWKGINSVLIKQGLSQGDRLEKLTKLLFLKCGLCWLINY